MLMVVCVSSEGEIRHHVLPPNQVTDTQIHAITKKTTQRRHARPTCLAQHDSPTVQQGAIGSNLIRDSTRNGYQYHRNHVLFQVRTEHASHNKKNSDETFMQMPAASLERMRHRRTAGRLKKGRKRPAFSSVASAHEHPSGSAAPSP